MAKRVRPTRSEAFRLAVVKEEFSRDCQKKTTDGNIAGNSSSVETLPILLQKCSVRLQKLNLCTSECQVKKEDSLRHSLKPCDGCKRWCHLPCLDLYFEAADGLVQELEVCAGCLRTLETGSQPLSKKPKRSIDEMSVIVDDDPVVSKKPEVIVVDLSDAEDDSDEGRKTPDDEQVARKTPDNEQVARKSPDDEQVARKTPDDEQVARKLPDRSVRDREKVELLKKNSEFLRENHLLKQRNEELNRQLRKKAKESQKKISELKRLLQADGNPMNVDRSSNRRYDVLTKGNGSLVLRRMSSSSDASVPNRDHIQYFKKGKSMSTFSDSNKFQEDDNYLYCYECDRENYGVCPVHGPMKRIYDSVVAADDPLRAEHSIPPGLTIDQSSLPNAGLGVWSNIAISAGTVFGPYEGRRVDVNSTQAKDSVYCWDIVAQKKTLYCIDGSNLGHSNWLRYVNCANYDHQQNLTAFQYKRHIFYRVIKAVAAGEELLVWYGKAYSKVLGLDSGVAGPENCDVVVCNGAPSSAQTIKTAVKRVTVPPSSAPATIADSSGSSEKFCLYCEAHFPDNSQLSAHQYFTHFSRPVYCCNTCDRIFDFHTEVVKHQQPPSTHTGVRRSYVNSGERQPGQCVSWPRQPQIDVQPAAGASAQKSTAQKGGSGRKSKSDQSLACAFCDLKFSKRHKLLEHKRRRHNNFRGARRVCHWKEDVQCSSCNWWFPSKFYLERHVKGEHPNTITSEASQTVTTGVDTSSDTPQLAFVVPIISAKNLRANADCILLDNAPGVLRSSSATAQSATAVPATSTKDLPVNDECIQLDPATGSINGCSTNGSRRTIGAGDKISLFATGKGRVAQNMGSAAVMQHGGQRRLDNSVLAAASERAESNEVMVATPIGDKNDKRDFNIEQMPSGLTVLLCPISGQRLGICVDTNVRAGYMFGKCLDKMLRRGQNSSGGWKLLNGWMVPADCELCQQFSASNTSWIRLIRCADKSTQDSVNLQLVFANGHLAYRTTSSLVSGSELWLPENETVTTIIASISSVRQFIERSASVLVTPIKTPVAAFQKCTFCNSMNFRDQSSLDLHQFRAHNYIPVYTCCECDAKCIMHYSLVVAHLAKAKHSKFFRTLVKTGKPLCDLCMIWFSDNPSYLLHKREKHPTSTNCQSSEVVTTTTTTTTTSANITATIPALTLDNSGGGGGQPSNVCISPEPNSPTEQVDEGANQSFGGARKSHAPLRALQTGLPLGRVTRPATDTVNGAVASMEKVFTAIREPDRLPPGIVVRYNTACPTFMGIFSTTEIPQGSLIGPCQGSVLRLDVPPSVPTNCIWQVIKQLELKQFIKSTDTVAPHNWLRYINLAGSAKEQNVVSIVYKGHLFFRTVRTIPKDTELLVWSTRAYPAEMEGLRASATSQLVQSDSALDEFSQRQLSSVGIETSQYRKTAPPVPSPPPPNHALPTLHPPIPMLPPAPFCPVTSPPLSFFTSLDTVVNPTNRDQPSGGGSLVKFDGGTICEQQSMSRPIASNVSSKVAWATQLGQVDTQLGDTLNEIDEIAGTEIRDTHRDIEEIMNTDIEEFATETRTNVVDCAALSDIDSLLDLGMTIKRSAFLTGNMGVWTTKDMRRGTMFGRFTGAVQMINLGDDISDNRVYLAVMHQYVKSLGCTFSPVARKSGLQYVSWTTNNDQPHNLISIMHETSVFYCAIKQIPDGAELVSRPPYKPSSEKNVLVPIDDVNHADKLSDVYCEMCGKCCESRSSLNRHQNECHNIVMITFTCTECQQQFDCDDDVWAHQRSTGHAGVGTTLVAPQDETELMRRTWATPETMESNEPRAICQDSVRNVLAKDELFSCRWCKYIFDSLAHFREHYSAWHGIEVVLACHDCGQDFKEHLDLVSHHQQVGHRGMDCKLDTADVRRNATSDPTPEIMQIPRSSTESVDAAGVTDGAQQTRDTSQPDTTTTTTVDTLSPSEMSSAVIRVMYLCVKCEQLIANHIEIATHLNQTKHAIYKQVRVLQATASNNVQIVLPPPYPPVSNGGANPSLQSTRAVNTFPMLTLALTSQNLPPQGAAVPNSPAMTRAVSRAFATRADSVGSSSQDRYRCELCNLYFLSLGRLAKHKLVQHSIGGGSNRVTRFKCSYCSLQFSTRLLLHYHLKNSHRNSGPANSPSGLWQVPSVEPSIEPENCDKEMDTAVATTSGDTPSRPRNGDVPSEACAPAAYKCHICDYTCDKPATLCAHQYRVHNIDKIYVCHACKSQFHNLGGLLAHQKKWGHHGADVNVIKLADKGNCHPTTANAPENVDVTGGKATSSRLNAISKNNNMATTLKTVLSSPELAVFRKKSVSSATSQPIPSATDDGDFPEDSIMSDAGIIQFDPNIFLNMDDSLDNASCDAGTVTGELDAAKSDSCSSVIELSALKIDNEDVGHLQSIRDNKIVPPIVETGNDISSIKLRDSKTIGNSTSIDSKSSDEDRNDVADTVSRLVDSVVLQLDNLNDSLTITNPSAPKSHESIYDTMSSGSDVRIDNPEKSEKKDCDFYKWAFNRLDSVAAAIQPEASENNNLVEKSDDALLSKTNECSTSTEILSIAVQRDSTAGEEDLESEKLSRTPNDVISNDLDMNVNDNGATVDDLLTDQPAEMDLQPDNSVTEADKNINSAGSSIPKVDSDAVIEMVDAIVAAIEEDFRAEDMEVDSIVENIEQNSKAEVFEEDSTDAAMEEDFRAASLEVDSAEVGSNAAGIEEFDSAASTITKVGTNEAVVEKVDSVAAVCETVDSIAESFVTEADKNINSAGSSIQKDDSDTVIEMVDAIVAAIEEDFSAEDMEVDSIVEDIDQNAKAEAIEKDSIDAAIEEDFRAAAIENNVIVPTIEEEYIAAAIEEEFRSAALEVDSIVADIEKDSKDIAFEKNSVVAALEEDSVAAAVTEVESVSATEEAGSNAADIEETAAPSITKVGTNEAVVEKVDSVAAACETVDSIAENYEKHNTTGEGSEEKIGDSFKVTIQSDASSKIHGTDSCQVFSVYINDAHPRLNGQGEGTASQSPASQLDDVLLHHDSIIPEVVQQHDPNPPAGMDTQNSDDSMQSSHNEIMSVSEVRVGLSEDSASSIFDVARDSDVNAELHESDCGKLNCGPKIVEQLEESIASIHDTIKDSLVAANLCGSDDKKLGRGSKNVDRSEGSSSSVHDVMEYSNVDAELSVSDVSKPDSGSQRVDHSEDSIASSVGDVKNSDDDSNLYGSVDVILDSDSKIFDQTDDSATSIQDVPKDSVVESNLCRSDVRKLDSGSPRVDHSEDSSTSILEVMKDSDVVSIPMLTAGVILDSDSKIFDQSDDSAMSIHEVAKYSVAQANLCESDGEQLASSSKKVDQSKDNKEANLCASGDGKLNSVSKDTLDISLDTGNNSKETYHTKLRSISPNTHDPAGITHEAEVAPSINLGVSGFRNCDVIAIVDLETEEELVAHSPAKSVGYESDMDILSSPADWHIKDELNSSGGDLGFEIVEPSADDDVTKIITVDLASDDSECE